MPAPSEKLAQSLEILGNLQNSNGIAAVRARDLSRTHRERLLANGFLQEVIKGWYIPSRPDEVKGESTAWYALFWRFCAVYLEARFGKEWCLSPEQSLSLHGGNRTVPRQLSREVTQSPQQSHQAPTRNVPAGPSCHPACSRRQGGKRRDAYFLARICPDCVFARLFFAQFN